MEEMKDSLVYLTAISAALLIGANSKIEGKTSAERRESQTKYNLRADIALREREEIVHPELLLREIFPRYRTDYLNASKKGHRGYSRLRSKAMNYAIRGSSRRKH